MAEARRREGVGFRPRPSNDAASTEHPRLSAKQKLYSPSLRWGFTAYYA